jgi:hypothetical protein
VIDDLHWADHATLLLTSVLLRSGRHAPLLVLGTYRDTELGRHSPLTGALAELQRDGALDRVGLRGLEEDDVAVLARELLGGGDAADLAAQVHARTDGNAFFVEQVLRGLADSPDLPESVVTPSASASRASATTPTSCWPPRPRSASSSTRARSRAPRRSSPTPPRPRSTRCCARGCCGARRPASASSSRTRSYARRSTTSSTCLRRARLHRRAAEALRALGEDRHLEEIAAHLFQAASPADAREVSAVLARAGRRALERLAYEDAASASSVRSMRSRSPTPRTRAGPCCSRAATRCCAPATRRPRTRRFAAAARLARRRGDAALLAEAALGFAGLGIAIVDLDAEAIARLEEALEAPLSPLVRVRLQARLAVELYYAPGPHPLGGPQRRGGRRRARLRRPERARRGAQRPPRRAVAPRPHRGAARAAADMIAAARQAREPHQELQARNWRVMDLYERGDMARLPRGDRTSRTDGGRAAAARPFQWYTPLWAATEARSTAAGRRRSGCGCRRRRRASAPAIATPGCSRRWSSRSCRRSGARSSRRTSPSSRTRSRTRPPGRPTGQALVWILRRLGPPDEARAQLDGWVRDGLAFDANWMSAHAEVAEGIGILGDPTHAPARLRPPAPLLRPPGDGGPRGRQLRLGRPLPRRASPPCSAAATRRSPTSARPTTTTPRSAARSGACTASAACSSSSPTTRLAAEVAATAEALDLPQLA